MASASPLSAFFAREIGFVAFTGAALYLLLAIGSYSPLDPAWTFAGSNLAVSNLVGRSGAFTADLMLLAFGWAAYLLPAGLVFAGVKLLRRGVPDFYSWAQIVVRVSGFLAGLMAICVLARLHFVAGANLPAGPGGALGSNIVAAGLPALNWIGLTLGALVVLLIGSQAALGYSWLALLENTGRSVHVLAQLLLTSMLATGRAVLRLLGKWRRTAVDQGATVAEPPIVAANRTATPLTRIEPVASPPVVDIEVRPAVANGEQPLSAVLVAEQPRPPKSPAPPPTTPPPTTPPAVTPKRSVTAIPIDTGHALGAVPEPMELPDLGLLEDFNPAASGGYSKESLEDMSRLLEVKLADFRVDAKVVSVLPGPVVTRFELQPAAGVKVSKFTALAKDLARSLAVVSVRIVEIIPGKSVVGIEIPNEERETVRLKEILDSRQYRQTDTALTLALGKDIAGVPVMADIGKMPHLLVAGTTGSGKSVGINAMLLSMLYKAKPDDLRLILVDPKMLELAVYDGIPHLLTPVVTDMKDAAQALNWCVAEMERRYQLMAAMGVRNLAGFNRRIAEALATDQPLLDPLWPTDAAEPAPPLTKLPFIVVVIDEFADMMMIVGKKVEQLIARIAQKARAAGIHLVLATQRPSVDVITGLIKANIPARIGFQVSSKIDSRTILDQSGAEQLLGHGDMLFLPPGTSMPMRVHGAFVSDDEVHAVAADWKQRGAPDYVADLLSGVPPEAEVPGTVDLSGDTESDEPLYDEAVAFVLESRRASISSVQRKLRIGYNRAARLIEAMEQAGLISPPSPTGGREVLAPGGPAD